MMFKDFFSLPLFIDSEIGNFLLVIFSILLIIACVKLIFAKTLLRSLITLSVFSILISVCYLLLDAPDVAMTEVALGSCLSTCVLLNFLRFIGPKGDNIKQSRLVIATILCLTFTFTLSLVSNSIPTHGIPNSPIQSHINPYYLEYTKHDIGTPSFVAAILASYRGYDTLGETAVILIAGLAVLLILAKKDENA